MVIDFREVPYLRVGGITKTSEFLRTGSADESVRGEFYKSVVLEYRIALVSDCLSLLLRLLILRKT
jgi:hypothetical protein